MILRNKNFVQLKCFLGVCQCDDSNALFTFAFHDVVSYLSIFATLAHVYLLNIGEQRFLFTIKSYLICVWLFLSWKIIYGCYAVIVIRHIETTLN